MEAESTAEGQYSLGTIFAIWLAAVVPMVSLGWGATALVGDSLDLGVGDQNGVFPVSIFVSRESDRVVWIAIAKEVDLIQL